MTLFFGWSNVVLLILIINEGSCSDDLNITQTRSMDGNNLVYIAVVSRHGSRTPYLTYPKDPYPNSNLDYWPNGRMELTNFGRLQMYELGRRLRLKYHGFFSNLYRPTENKFFYNNHNRDQTSAACIAAGLYPPGISQVWNTAIPWQPAVLHIRELDICDAFESKTVCPAYTRDFFSQVQILNSRSPQYKDLIDYVSINSGTNFTNNLLGLYTIADVFSMQQENSFRLPLWANQIYYTQLKPLANSLFSEMTTGGPNQIRLGSGPELKIISDLLTNKVDGKEESKLYVEAAHDCTILLILRAMGIQNPNLEIKTGAHLVFELRTSAGNGHVVKVLFYKTPYEISPEDITIINCSNPCPLSDFVAFVNRINPPNWNEACK